MHTLFHTVFSPSSRAKDVLAVLIAALMLLFWALFNGYPLFFSSDTAMYLEAAFAQQVGPDRPILYGLFMYFLSFRYSLWLVVIVQALIVAYLFYLWFRYYSAGNGYLKYYLIFIGLIAFFMGASFNVSWLMPDVFAPIAVLSIGLMLFASSLPMYVWGFLSVMTIVGVAIHNSHLYICLGLVMIGLFGYVFGPIRKLLYGSGIKLKRLFLLVGLILFSALFSAYVNYVYGGGFSSSRGGKVFLMGSLVEMGVMDAYLGENCEHKNYRICAYRDTIPNNFLWASNSPIYQQGGWAGSEAEYSDIVGDILTTPKYLKSVVWKSVLRTFSQLMHFDTGEATLATPRIDMTFKRFFANEYDNFYNGKQNQGKLDFRFVNHCQMAIFMFSGFIYALVFYKNGMSMPIRTLILFILMALLINAWVCGTFSGVYFRYQARLLWLIPLPIFLFLSKYNRDKA